MLGLGLSVRLLKIFPFFFFPHLVEDFFIFPLFMLVLKKDFLKFCRGLHASRAFPSLLHKDNPLTVQHLSSSSF